MPHAHLGDGQALLAGAGASTLGVTIPAGPSLADSAAKEYRLTAKTATVNLTGDGYPDTAVWAYDAIVPGPELRVRQGEPVRIRALRITSRRRATAIKATFLALPRASSPA